MNPLSDSKIINLSFKPCGRYRRFSLILLLALGSSSCTLEDIISGSSGSGGGGLSSEDIIKGLKAALNLGIDSASSQLSQVNGYLLNEAITIILPEDVENALNYADQIDSTIQSYNPLNLFPKEAVSIPGFDFSFSDFRGLREDLKTSINRAAEAAAPLSVGIFKTAILDMTINDGMSILQGDTTAATDYLSGKTLSPLTSAYSPFVKDALDSVNANQIWNDFSTMYNSLRNLYGASIIVNDLIDVNLQPLTTDLATYTTDKALFGLFVVVGEEEAKIRRDPMARVSDILEKVFGLLDE